MDPSKSPQVSAQNQAPWGADPAQNFVGVYPPTSPQAFYIQGPPTTQFLKLPEEDPQGAPVAMQGVVVSPLAMQNGAVADEILAQEYEVNISKWFCEGWAIYKQNWLAFSLFTIFIFALAFIPYLGPWLTLPLHFGFFIAVTNKIRYNGMTGDIRYDHFLFGFLYYLPILVIGLLSLIIVLVGLIMCIIPGLYALFALTFAIPVFLEYHDQKIGIIGSMLLSMRVLNKHVLEMILFLILNALFSISGILLLGVGLIVTIPVSYIALAMCFKDLYGLNPRKEQNPVCVVC